MAKQAEQTNAAKKSEQAKKSSVKQGMPPSYYRKPPKDKPKGPDDVQYR